ncbi:hypothetical protein QQS21_002456 [Conoideocrella luteorostrata]|uniref:Cytochrome P450 n=1 Tax=Conoideocrella luteorostrata TaxID=1105319 RepID=A0AAJ0G2W9_9HYPO|nr:hypothetical protein QQS21_002456 [Conoideocrella luteorostrata]
MNVFIPAIVALVFIVLAAFHSYQLPRHIPRIPIWVTIYETYAKTSRISFYNKHVRGLAEEYGAVTIWHLGRWSIHITEPRYLIQMFRDEKSFAKGGSYKRVPWGPLGQLFGENIIDSTGHVWKQQRSILQSAIKRPFDIAYTKQKSSELLARVLREHDLQDKDRRMGIDIDEHVQYWSLSICCKYFMDVDLEGIPNISNRLTRILTDQKLDLMGGVVTLFPVLQRLPWLFPSTRRAFCLVEEFEKIVLEIAKLNRHNESGPDSNTIISCLNNARQNGAISEFHYRSHLKQLLLAGHEEVEPVLLSAVVEIARNRQIQSALQAETSYLVPHTYNLEDLDKLPLTLAVILETLRLHPPFPSLTNRYTTQKVRLGNDINVPAGTWIGWNAYGVQTDPRIWGSDALVFRPERWGKDVANIKAMFRAQQAKAVFIPFSTHSRTCLGITFALMQLKVGLYELLSEIEWGIYNDNMPALSKGSRILLNIVCSIKLTLCRVR